jgi:hypothetical protein
MRKEKVGQIIFSSDTYIQSTKLPRTHSNTFERRRLYLILLLKHPSVEDALLLKFAAETGEDF